MLKTLKRVRWINVMLLLISPILVVGFILAVIALVIAILLFANLNNDVGNLNKPMTQEEAIQIVENIEENGEISNHNGQEVMTNGKYYIMNRTLYNTKTDEEVRKYFDAGNPYWKYIQPMKSYTILYNNQGSWISCYKKGKVIGKFLEHYGFDVYPENDIIVILENAERNLGDVYTISVEEKENEDEQIVGKVFEDIEYSGNLTEYGVTEKPIKLDQEK